MKKIKTLLFVMALLSIQLANAATYYVSPNGVSTNSGSQGSPWSIQHAANQTTAGDIVYFLTGTYNFTGLTINNSGTSSAYIKYANAPGASPVLQVPNPCGLWQAINVQANYIKIEGLELIGNNANITLAFAEQIYAEVLAGGSDWARYGQTNTNGISVGNSAIVPHHTEIRNCSIHDFSGSGIATVRADFTIIENNYSYNNQWFSIYAGSGISLNNHQNSTSSYSGTANIIRDNCVYNNKSLVKWIDIQDYSDGNGIIIDSFDKSSYKGYTLIENNIVFSNGGSGLYVMASGYVTFRNNTSYWNSTETAKGTGVGELVCLDAHDITWVNNIGVANPSYGAEVFAIVDNGDWGNNERITWKNNLSYNGTAGQSSVKIAKTTTTSIDGTNKLGVNPLFVSPTTNFRLQSSSSPAVNAGTSSYGTYATDYEGATRIQGGAIDMGAYESAFIANSVTITSAPSSISQSGTYNINVDYAAAQNGKIWVALWAPNWSSYYSSNQVSVNSGSGTVTIPITISNVPVNTGLHWNASLRDNSDVQLAGWVQDNVSVTSNNLVTNPSFDSNTTGWSLYLNSPAAATIASVTQSGYTGKACKATITNKGSASWHIQMLQTIPLTAGKTYTITFKASAAANRTIDLMFQQGVSPKTVWYSQYGISLTTTPTTKGPYTFTCTTTDASNQFRFLLGNSTSAVFIDDVEIKATTTKSAIISESEIANNEVNKLNIYPNPVTNGNVNVEISNNSNNAVIRIFDLQGKELYKKTSAGLTSININTSDFLKAGIYIIKVQNENLDTTRKLIIK
jgi:hypothetical protein